MKKIAIITARGGSKRIPRKNIKPFAGRPIIEYSIEAALQSNCFDEVMVSTDDEEIAETGKQCGAKVPFFRSERTSNDFATTVDVLIEVIDEYEKRGQQFETLCCIYPTAPFVTGEKLKQAFDMFDDMQAVALITLTKFDFPILRSFRMDGHKVMYNWPEYETARSQDLPAAYHDAGQFYITRTKSLKENKSLVTSNTIGFEISELECHDIDTETDWKLAELKYHLLHHPNGLTKE